MSNPNESEAGPTPPNKGAGGGRRPSACSRSLTDQRAERSKGWPDRAAYSDMYDHAAEMERRWNEAEKRIRELKEDREIIHQDCDRWRLIAKDWKRRHDQLSENADAQAPKAAPKDL